MDKISAIQDIIQQDLEARASRKASNMPGLERTLIMDAQRSRFILLSLGWNETQYIHQCLIHVQIKGNKIWIHEDLTDPGLFETLIEKGIHASDIVLGYVPDSQRIRQVLHTV